MLYTQIKIMTSTYSFVSIAILALAFTRLLVHASDPSPLQDFCVAVNDAVDGGMYMLSRSLSLILKYHNKYLLLLEEVVINTYDFVLVLCSVCEREILQGP